jgi:hypothetical protein
MNLIPAGPLYPSNRGLVQAFDTEGGDLIDGRATMLESTVWRTGVRAERLSVSSATISTTRPPSGFIESVANDVSGNGLWRHSALPVWAAETLHSSWTVSIMKLIG